MARPQVSLEDRFWAKVQKQEGDGHWIWVGYRDGRNQGYIRGVTGKLLRVQKVSYVLVYGNIPDGMFVYRTCAEPLCVRPDHLFLSTK
jgi:hypothetical protein